MSIHWLLFQWACIIKIQLSMLVLYKVDLIIIIIASLKIYLFSPWYRWINSCAKSAWYARRQHSYNICKDFLSHNSSMKNLNFTNSCTINMNWNIYTYDTFFEKSVKTINSNNSMKFEMNWRRGSQFTARHTKNRLQFDE
jgi:hypothetical protein